jgi:hypothetical protein
MDQPSEGVSGGETSSPAASNHNGASRGTNGPKIDQEFLEKRRAQCMSPLRPFETVARLEFL